jgi:hypothetical protein
MLPLNQGGRWEGDAPPKTEAEKRKEAKKAAAFGETIATALADGEVTELWRMEVELGAFKRHQVRERPSQHTLTPSGAR